MTAAAIASAAAKIVEAQSALWAMRTASNSAADRIKLFLIHKLLGEALQALAGEAEGKS